MCNLRITRTQKFHPPSLSNKSTNEPQDFGPQQDHYNPYIINANTTLNQRPIHDLPKRNFNSVMIPNQHTNQNGMNTSKYHPVRNSSVGGGLPPRHPNNRMNLNLTSNNLPHSEPQNEPSDHFQSLINDHINATTKNIMGSVEQTAKNEAEIDALELEKILMNGHSNLISEQNIGQVEEGNSVKRVV